MDNVFLSLAGNHPLMENGGFPVMVQNPHFASWTQLSAQTAGNAAAAAAAAAVHPGAASFQFPNANSLQQHLQPPDSSTATSRGVTLETSASVTGINNANFSLGLQPSASLTLQHSIPSQTHTHSQQHQQLHQHQIQLQQQQQHQLQLQQQIQLQQQQFRQQQQQLQQDSLQQQARLSNPPQQQQQLHQHLQQRQPAIISQSQQMNQISGLQTTSTSTSQSMPVIPNSIGFSIQSSPTSQATPAVSQLSPRTSILNATNFPLFTAATPVKQKRKSKTTSKKLQVDVISSSVVYNTNIPTCGVVSTLCSTSTAATSFGMIPLNGSLSSISSTVQTNSVSSNPITSISETCVSPLTTVLSPLPTLPEEILLKIDPSLGDPPPPPHADITITKPYQCDLCFKRYSGLKSLKNHKLTHSDIRPHKCSICGKAFLRADKMRLHEISHLNVKPFECATCKQRFTRSDKLKIHHRTHTGVRPYACTFCPKRFTRSDKLKIHERIHTKVKPYECSHCGKCFARSDKRRLHEKTHMYGPKPRATGSKKSKTTSAAAAAAAAAAAVVAAASAASFLTVNSIGKTLGLPLTVPTPSISVNNSSCNVFDFSSITNVCTTNQNNICFPSYHVVSSTPSTGNEKSDDAQQIPTSLSTISFPLPTCQHLHLPSQHHSTLASLAGIAQYHPALFSANPRQFPHNATVANPVSFYPTNQTSSMGFTTANSGSYHHAQVMPFLVNSSNAGPSSSISLLGSNAVSDNTNSNCSVANTSSVYQSSSSQKMGTVVTSFPASTPNVTQRSELSSIADSVPMNPSSSTVSNTNIAAVMAAAALGRQFHQSQQQYPQIVAYSGSQQMPNVSAFIHQQQRQQSQESQQSQQTGQQQMQQQQAHFIHHQTQSKQVQSQQHSPQQQQQQPRPQFQFYQPQFAHQFQHSTAQLQQHDHQHQMLQHQQQVIQLHQQIQQQQQQQQQAQKQQQAQQTHQQQQQLMQQHSAMLQQQGLISPAHSNTSVAAFSLFPQAAAQFIPGVVPAQYAAAAAAHSTHQQYMQVQQQQQYLAAAAAAAAASSGPIHSLTLTTSHQPNSTTSITPTTSSVIT
ncbi:hypothetical protein MN116_008648 [Schistosoma mekongi]|uniref:C2H2-type domain-containing protein n=1 Tax=Schistosoma mekongi TaxID=38744 RepID=A0AAE1Z5T9_SCHME|nr:hypothetical protein MN116_008648 [Schistosoma mekongi]